MSKIVIFSAANPHAAANLRHSVVDGVPLAQVGDSRMLGALKAQGGSIRLWGSASGEAGRKLASWRRIDPPAVAFFYTEGSFRLTGRIWAKEPPVSENEQGNPGLAETVWGDPSFEHIVYLDELQAVDISPETMKAALGYEPGYPLGREFVVPSEATQETVLASFGSPEAFRDALIAHVGTPKVEAFRAVALPETSLGTNYRKANENVKTVRVDVFRVDPDRVDRGTQAHAKTQNLLAGYVASQGHAPRSWSIAEPPFDLAWESGHSFYVAEVKSLTSENEERQLRFALGQILRYAQQLSYKAKPIEKVIAVEREPSDSSWVELCESCGITIVWPETFNKLSEWMDSRSRARS